MDMADKCDFHGRRCVAKWMSIRQQRGGERSPPDQRGVKTKQAQDGRIPFFAFIKILSPRGVLNSFAVFAAAKVAARYRQIYPRRIVIPTDSSAPNGPLCSVQGPHI